jgi:DNA-binding transcriptional MerR regulator
MRAGSETSFLDALHHTNQKPQRRTVRGARSRIIFVFHRQAGALLPKSSQAFRTISEVAAELDIQKHVLRFWESKFNQLKPMKRGGGRRYYRPEDVELLRGIHHLLRSQAYTIKGVQRILREQGVDFVKAVWQGGAAASKAAVSGAVATQGRGKRGVVPAVEMAAPAGHQTVKAKRGAAAAVASGHLSAEDTKALQSVVDQLEAARQSLAKTRKIAQATPKTTAKTPAAAKERVAPKARTSSKRS